MTTRTVGPRSQELFSRAQQCMPGGVNSPVRAFHAVGGEPMFMTRGAGARIWDADGRGLIDYVGSWGPLLFGHAHPRIVAAIQEAAALGTSFGAPTELEVQLAERICALVPSVEMVRLVSSGTEAAMSAIRLARAYTSRAKIIKFNGCYHGHADPFLIKAGSGVATLGLPNSPGVTSGAAADTLTADFNDAARVDELFDANSGAIACVILEPVAGNIGVVPPQRDFLRQLRTMCDEHGSLLVFDEVMTGFRLAAGGAQEIYGVQPDLSVFGKVIGGGMPIGAYGGRRNIMEMVAPSGPMYQAGTLSGNPVSVAAGLAMLDLIRTQPDVYGQLEARAARLEAGLRAHIERAGITACVQRVGSMWTIFFGVDAARNYAEAGKCDVQRFATFFHAAIERGVYLAPSQFEACFLSLAHDDAIIDETLLALGEAIREAAR